MSDKRWKRQERRTSAVLGSQRNANNGEHRTDIDAGPFAVEHKTGKTLTAWLTGALDQASRADGGRMPVILSEISQGRQPHAYVLLALDDWLDRHVATRSDTYSQAAADRTEIAFRISIPKGAAVIDTNRTLCILADMVETAMQQRGALVIDYAFPKVHLWVHRASIESAIGSLDGPLR
jgi:hypothetical protein